MHLGMSSVIVCISNAQANDLTRRLATRFPRMRVQRLTASGVRSVPSLTGLPNVVVDYRASRGFQALVTTVAKLIDSPNAPGADMLMVDESYQLKHSDYSMVRGLAPRALMIGDPGQIDPIVQVPVRHWASSADGPHLPAPRVVLQRNEARRFQLPVSRRLPC